MCCVGLRGLYLWTDVAASDTAFIFFRAVMYRSISEGGINHFDERYIRQQQIHRCVPTFDCAPLSLGTGLPQDMCSATASVPLLLREETGSAKCQRHTTNERFKCFGSISQLIRLRPITHPDPISYERAREKQQYRCQGKYRLLNVWPVKDRSYSSPAAVLNVACRSELLLNITVEIIFVLIFGCPEELRMTFGLKRQRTTSVALVVPGGIMVRPLPQRRCSGKMPVRTQVLHLRAPEDVVNTPVEITEEKKEARAAKLRLRFLAPKVN
ncbi:hypothetical protein F2P81_024082 [Scophthalmus maximus]|uniref:Uncharacterized protein n=1 Tax=Scophthalmus maximus TaxID=52904 RepID=A0A6A4RWH0_SCOMX|nr:hypothetical protein F2P81_024082 [Scophthalmus maximus]